MKAEMHRRALVAGLAASTVGAARARAAAAARRWEVEVDVQTARFSPGALTIQAGDTVEWMNPSFILHSVDFDPRLSKVPGNVALPAGVEPFASGDMGQDATFSHTFTVRGVYKYVCQYHEDMGMIATVTVT